MQVSHFYHLPSALTLRGRPGPHKHVRLRGVRCAGMALNTFLREARAEKWSEAGSQAAAA